MIRKLPPELIREIAAGEVVSRPADVLKELLENALDAGATRLEVALEGGGITLLRVGDNGAGIARDELAAATELHCTSKLDDLAMIRTLGFRGEGLYAIRHAARLELTSRPAGQLGGATLTAEGVAQALNEHPAPAGTTVTVRALFARLPARRRALESEASETRACLAVLGRYLLHHPQLALRVVVDGEERWVYAGGGAREAAKFLWGPVTANRLLPLRAEEGACRLTGLLSRPELARPRKDRLHLAVNGRPVSWPEPLLKALLAGYRELLGARHFPVGVLELWVPETEVLVNTAPDKRRVKLLDEAAICAFAQRSVEAALAAQPLARPLLEPRGEPGVGAAPPGGFPGLRYLGTYAELYLLAEAEAQLWVVDQHAAHERVLFEELEARYRAEPPAELDAPELVQLSAQEVEAYLERRTALAEFGLALEPFGAGSWRVRSVPAFLLGHPQLVAEVVKGALGRHDTEEAWRAVLARLACLPAVRAGHALAAPDAQALLNALSRCRTPWVCPHGRPTALVLSELELAKRFGRRGPRTKTPAARYAGHVREAI